MAGGNFENKTAQALIQAAGRLFAARGIDGVTTREISAEAGGIDISLIKYHFGAKEGLIQAVAEAAMKPLQEFSLEDYYRENAGLLASRDGQRVFVTGMIEVIFNRFSNPAQAEWSKGFLLQILQKHGDEPMRKALITRYMKPMAAVFARVYREVTGNEDTETALCWYLFITAQLFVCSGDSDLVGLLRAEGVESGGFARRMKYFCTRQVLAGFHLISEDGEARQ